MSLRGADRLAECGAPWWRYQAQRRGWARGAADARATTVLRAQSRSRGAPKAPPGVGSGLPNLVQVTGYAKRGDRSRAVAKHPPVVDAESHIALSTTRWMSPPSASRLRWDRSASATQEPRIGSPDKRSRTCVTITRCSQSTRAVAACNASPEAPTAMPRSSLHARTVSCAMSRISLGDAR